MCNFGHDPLYNGVDQMHLNGCNSPYKKVVGPVNCYNNYPNEEPQTLTQTLPNDPLVTGDPSPTVGQ